MGYCHLLTNSELATQPPLDLTKSGSARRMISKDNSRDAALTSGSELVATDADVCAPGQHDVICGRGKISRDHVGNRRFRTIVNRHKKRYRDAETKDDKTRVSLSVLDIVRNSCDPPGRFLKLNLETGTWYDVGEKGARERVSLALRTAKDEPLKAPKPEKKRKREEKVAPTVDGEKIAALLAKQKEILKVLIEVAEADKTDSDSDSSTDDNEQQNKKRRWSEDENMSCP